MPDGPIRTDVEVHVKRGDLRDIKHAVCACGHKWCAPVIGRCPKCRAEGAKIVEELMLGAPRV